jgi:hypothetical protein
MSTGMAAAGEVFMSAGLEGPARDARGYIVSSRSANTVRAYRSDWVLFTAWGVARLEMDGVGQIAAAAGRLGW